MRHADPVCCCCCGSYNSQQNSARPQYCRVAENHDGWLRFGDCVDVVLSPRSKIPNCSVAALHMPRSGSDFALVSDPLPLLQKSWRALSSFGFRRNPGNSGHAKKVVG